jgi:hypothetical protein
MLKLALYLSSTTNRLFILFTVAVFKRLLNFPKTVKCLFRSCFSADNERKDWGVW